MIVIPAHGSSFLRRKESLISLKDPRIHKDDTSLWSLPSGVYSRGGHRHFITIISLFYHFTISPIPSYLGQNFLTDNSIRTRIAQQVRDNFVEGKHTTLIEIGPGKGALTKKIIDITDRLALVEYDYKMIEHLQTNYFPSLASSLPIIHADVLQRTPETDRPRGTLDDTLKGSTLIVGNLPYYITSPILRKFFEGPEAIRGGGVFLIQKEVAEKVVYDAPKKSFLRWLINYAYHVEYCFSVPPKAFTPPPKVTSAVIRLTPKHPHDIIPIPYDQMFVFLDQYSPYKRKTLGASSKIVTKLAKKNNSFGSDGRFDVTPYTHLRLEELGWEEMKYIIYTYSKTNKTL